MVFVGRKTKRYKIREFLVSIELQRFSSYMNVRQNLGQNIGLGEG